MGHTPWRSGSTSSPPKAVVLELLLISICIVDDSSVIPNVILENHLARAVVDTLTHGVIAALSWLLVTDFQMNTKNLTEVMLCGVFGMVIDVDHFIAAGSLSLSAATSLSKRPFFHNSSLIPIIYLLLRGLQQWLPGLPASMAWMFLLAWTSHHVRDGIRHGLWFAPFGSTPAVPKWLYISVISLCPLLLRAVLLLGRSNNVQGRNSSTTDHHETASLMTV